MDIGEIDIVLIKPEQNVRLEVDAFKDQKFKGTVTAIANASKGFEPGGDGLREQPDAGGAEVRGADSHSRQGGVSAGDVGHGGNRDALAQGRADGADPKRDHAAAGRRGGGSHTGGTSNAGGDAAGGLEGGAGREANRGGLRAAKATT